MESADESNALFKSTTILASAAEAAKRLEKQFAEAGLRINPTSDLARLIKDAIAVGDVGVGLTSDERDTVRAVLSGQHMDRIARATSVLVGKSDARTHLWPLKKDAIDHGVRSPSRAKDKLWELELLYLLEARNLVARLSEPDLIVSLSCGELALACKRVYSATNAESQLSNGVKQIDASGMHGLLAICIDDLLPSHCIIEAQDPSHAAAFLDNHNGEFLSRHGAQLAAYIATKRIAGVLVSSSSPIRHPPLAGEIASSMQCTIWTTPACDTVQLPKLAAFRSVLFESPDSLQWSAASPAEW